MVMLYQIALLHAIFFVSALADKPSVLIIGAGPAGIAAATTLLENSISNITILEAENRIGGRINSVEFDGDYVDLGAQFCYAEEGNAVYELVKDLNLLSESDSSQNVKIYNSAGGLVSSDLTNDLFEFIFDYTNSLEAKTVNDTLKDVLQRKYRQTILEKYKSDEAKFKLAKECFDTIEQIINLSVGAFSLDKVAAQSRSEDSSNTPFKTWKKRGYHRVLDILMKSYPNPSEKLPIDDKIHLNKKVNKVVWSGSIATVETSDGSKFSANYIIFTPSIGVLKKYKSSLFEPQLPPEKQLTLDTIGFDGTAKIYLHFTERWWKKDDFIFYFIWDKNHVTQIKNELPDGPNKDGISWVTSICALQAVTNHPNVLLAWVSGEQLPEIEKSSDEEIQRGAMYAIRKFLNKDYNVTDMDQMLRTHWYTNPNFLGTSSFDKVGYYKENVLYRSVLSTPLMHEQKPVVLFAGEATSPTHYGTVHGAIETGRREAQRIIDLHK